MRLPHEESRYTRPRTTNRQFYNHLNMRSYCLYLIHTTASDEREKADGAHEPVVQQPVPSTIDSPHLSPIPAHPTMTAAHPDLFPTARGHSGRSSTSQGDTWTPQIDVWPRWRRIRQCRLVVRKFCPLLVVLTSGRGVVKDDSKWQDGNKHDPQ